MQKIKLVELFTSGKCWKCAKDLHTAPGQVAFWHSECRIEGRKMLTKGKMALKV